MENLEYITNELITLLHIPSPSGNTSEIMLYIEKELNHLGVPFVRTQKGALLATLKGASDRPQRLLTAHVDTLGAMVKEILPNGTLRLTNIGGFRWNSVEGEYCLVETADGRKIGGTILTTKPSVHVYKDTDKLERSEENMVVRLDEITKSAEDTRGLGIEVGDFVSFDPRVQVADSGFIKSRHLDDKASVAILLGLLKQFQADPHSQPAYTTHFLISNNEEIGYGGNSNIPSEVKEYLAVDMGAIGVGQTTDEFCVSICAKDSSGPYHKEFRQKLVKLAKQEGIYYKVDIYPYYGSDASAALRAGHDIVHGLIGPGIDASHSHERTHKQSLENTYRLLYSYLLSK